jgi:hypothetical protein
MELPENPQGKNWYIQSRVTGIIDGQYVQREAKTAFSYALPSATLVNLHMQKEEPFSFTATLQVSTSSRYSLQGVLWGTTSLGEIKPIAISQSAIFSTPGKTPITLRFAKPANTYQAPFYLGNLVLTDYGQLKPVYVREEKIPLKILEPT